MIYAPINHDHFIRHTLNLARRGIGKVSPNPMVGAILVSPQGEILAEGLHQRYGGPHAEVDAISAGLALFHGDLSSLTLYCSLEPCCHNNKKTPPCTELIIKSKIKKVVVATLDPNPLVCGKGVEVLRQAGISVEVGFLTEEAQLLNERFFHFMQTGLPFVHLKWAQTIDGFIATTNGESKWITGDLSRERAHKLRGINDGILVGMNTILKDNPQLNIRLPEKNHPWRAPRRIILGHMEHLPFNAHVVSDLLSHETILCNTEHLSRDAQEKLQSLNCTMIDLSEVANLDLLRQLLLKLGEFNISSILVEGGAQVLRSFLCSGLVQKVSIFIAPKILGQGLNAIGELNITDINKSLRLENKSIETLGEDILIEGKITGI